MIDSANVSSTYIFIGRQVLPVSEYSKSLLIRSYTKVLPQDSIFAMYWTWTYCFKASISTEWVVKTICRCLLWAIRCSISTNLSNAEMCRSKSISSIKISENASALWTFSRIFRIRCSPVPMLSEEYLSPEERITPEKCFFWYVLSNSSWYDLFKI